MGGTFDPVHHGHLVAASEVASVFGLDEVIFVPTGQPWQKLERVVSPAEHRYLMTVIATASNPRFTVSRVDIDRDGPTYTIDTLRDLAAQRSDAELYFITGRDIALLTTVMNRLLLRRVGDECLALNNVGLAARLANGWHRRRRRPRHATPSSRWSGGSHCCSVAIRCRPRPRPRT